MKRIVATLAVGALVGFGLAAASINPTPSSADVSTAAIAPGPITPGGTVTVSGTKDSVDSEIRVEIRGTQLAVNEVFITADPAEYCTNTEVNSAGLNWSCSYPLTDLPPDGLVGFARPDNGWSLEVSEIDPNDATVTAVTLPFAVVLGTPTIVSVLPDPRFRSSAFTITGTKDPGMAISIGLYNNNQDDPLDPFVDETVFVTGSSTLPGASCTDVGTLSPFAGSLATTWQCTISLGVEVLSATANNRILLSQFYQDGGITVTQSQTGTPIPMLDDRPIPVWTSTESGPVVDHVLPTPLAGEPNFLGSIDIYEIVGGTDQFIRTCSVPCSLADLAPAIYAVDSYTERGGIFSTSRFDVVALPETPTITNIEVQPDSGVLLTGTATPSSSVVIVDGDGATVCEATAAPDGTFSCVSAPLPPGEYTFRASARSSVDPTVLDGYTGVVAQATFLNDVSTGLSPATTALTIAQPTPPAIDPPPIEPPTQAAPDAPPAPLPSPEADIPTTADPAPETASAPLPPVVPLTPPGEAALLPPESTVVIDATGEVVAPEPAVEVTNDGGDDGAGGAPAAPGTNAAAGTDRDNPSAPSAFTSSLPTAWNILDRPVILAAAFGFALLVMLLLAIPSELLTSTLASSEHRLGAGYRRAQSIFSAIGDGFARVVRATGVRITLMIGAMAIIFGFADPNFGFDAVSLRLTASIALSLFVLYYLGARLTQVIVHRAWGLRGAIEALPTALLLAVIGVVVARLIDFSPGFLIGLALGFSVLVETTAKDRMRVALVTASVLFAMSIAAWLGYSLVTETALSASFLGVFAVDTLVAITTEGLTGLIIVLLPLTFFDGHAIWQEAKGAWVVAYLLAVTAFAAVVLPASFDEFGAVEELIGWLIPVAIFGIITFILWAWLRREPTVADTPADAEATPPAPVGR